MLKHITISLTGYDVLLIVLQWLWLSDDTTSSVTDMCRLQLKGSVKEPNISVYFFFLLITQWCSISDVLFTGGRGVSDFSALKYY